MKGIILAGGKATRLDPISRVVNKHLLSIYNKPMIYYPLTTLLVAGVRDILIITSHEYLDSFSRLLSDGSQFGIRIQYAGQEQPAGLPEAFLIGEKFIDNRDVALILGDNLYWGPRLHPLLHLAQKPITGAQIFTKRVQDPSQYGVMVRDLEGRPVELIEKPAKATSNEAVTGLYFFDGSVVENAKTLTPSFRNELEITDLLRIYLARGDLRCELLDGIEGGVEWYDVGTPDNMVLASSLIRGAEHEGALIGSPEAWAFQQKYIDKSQVMTEVNKMGDGTYSRNLKTMVK